jgi:hypothetical protein
VVKGIGGILVAVNFVVITTSDVFGAKRGRGLGELDELVKTGAVNTTAS